MNGLYDPRKHDRRSIRLKGYDYSRAGAYFITIVVKRRECLFGEIADGQMQLNEFGHIVESVWDQLPARYPGIELDSFGVMPNHVHGVVVITADAVGANPVGAIHELPLPESLLRESPPRDTHDPAQRRKMLLPKIVGYFKMNAAKQINLARQTPGLPLWHRNYYEHIIRNEADLKRIRDYIQANPARWAGDQLHPGAPPNRFNREDS